MSRTPEPTAAPPGPAASRPAPTPEEAAAIAAAVHALLEAERARAPDDRTPDAYRSAWRRAALREGAGVDDTAEWRSGVR